MHRKKRLTTRTSTETRASCCRCDRMTMQVEVTTTTGGTGITTTATLSRAAHADRRRSGAGEDRGRGGNARPVRADDWLAQHERYHPRRRPILQLVHHSAAVCRRRSSSLQMKPETRPAPMETCAGDVRPGAILFLIGPANYDSSATVHGRRQQ